MKKIICDKCKKEILKGEKSFNEHGYDLCNDCYNKLQEIIHDFFDRKIVGEFSVPKSFTEDK